MQAFIKNLCAILLLCCGLLSCSEDNNTTEEYPNWQQTNEAYFNNLYTEVQQRIAAGDTSWKIIRKWSLENSVHLNPDDHVIAHVISEGTGTTRPLYSDTVYVHYQGRLLPSTSYPTGYVFDKTWLNEYNAETMRPVKLGVSQTATPSTSAYGTVSYQYSSNIDGFTTVLMEMHEGDRWEVYIPYALGYGTEDKSGSIPAFSTLIFDLTLVSCHHAGETVPTYQAKQLW